METSFQISGPLGWVVDRMREIRERAEEEARIEAERASWMVMHEAIIEDGGSLDSD
jgi:hypothetical protein